jgi:hypothetical protein
MSISGTLEAAGITFYPAILSIIGVIFGLLAPGFCVFLFSML